MPRGVALLFRDPTTIEANRSADPRWLRDQIEQLADHMRYTTDRPDPQQMNRLLLGISRGVDWRVETWR